MRVASRPSRRGTSLRQAFTAVSVAATAATSALAIGPRAPAGGAAVADVAHPEVGVIGNQDSNPASNATYFGTGTKVANPQALLNNNLVATCAHVLDSDFLINGQLQYSSQTNEFKVDGQPATRGLGIPHPLYNPLNGNMGANDAGLILTATPVPGGSARFVTGADGLAVADPITLVGYGGRGAAPGGPFGTRLTGTANISALNPTTISFSVPNPSPGAGTNINWTEPGDSGSPYFKNVAGAGMPADVRIVGIHNRGNSGINPLPNPVTFSGQRVTDPAVNGFLLGNGLGDAANTALILSWRDNTSANFDTAARWTDGLALGIAAGGVGKAHIANLNTPGATPTITVNADRTGLIGLLNDDRLDVTGGSLFVTGAVTAPGPGVFNGSNGMINVGTARSLQTSTLDNTGAINVAAGGQVICSQASYNQATITVNGGIAGATIVRGVVAFNQGGRNLAPAVIHIDLGSMEARGFDNRGTMSLIGGAFGTTNNSNFVNSGTFLATQKLIPPGGLAASFVNFSADLDNSRFFRLDKGTIGAVARDVTNSGTLIVTGKADDTASTPSKLTVLGNTTNSGSLLSRNGATIELKTLQNNANGRVLTQRDAGEAGATISVSGTTSNASGGSVVAGGAGIILLTGTTTNDGNMGATGAGARMNTNKVTNNNTIEVSLNGGFLGDTLTNATGATVTVTSGTMTINKNPGSRIDNNGTITVRGPVAKAMLASKFINNVGFIKVDNGGTITYGDYNNPGKWRDPNGFSIGHNQTVITETGDYAGPGTIMSGGNFINLSQQATTFDMTQAELQFIDPESLTPIEQIDDPDMIFDPSPAFLSRTVAEMRWPSLDLTPGDSPTPGGATVYVRSLSLIPGPEDSPGTSSVLDVLGSLVTTPDITTLDVRGSVIYLAESLGTLPTNTQIIDSLDPGRPLSDMIRPLSLGLFPSSNFNIDRLVINGADYVVMNVPEPTALALFGLALFAVAHRRGRPR